MEFLCGAQSGRPDWYFWECSSVCGVFQFNFGGVHCRINVLRLQHFPGTEVGNEVEARFNATFVHAAKIYYPSRK